MFRYYRWVLCAGLSSVASSLVMAREWEEPPVFTIREGNERREKLVRAYQAAVDKLSAILRDQADRHDEFFETKIAPLEEQLRRKFAELQHYQALREYYERELINNSASFGGRVEFYEFGASGPKALPLKAALNRAELRIAELAGAWKSVKKGQSPMRIDSGEIGKLRRLIPPLRAKWEKEWQETSKLAEQVRLAEAAIGGINNAKPDASWSRQRLLAPLFEWMKTAEVRAFAKLIEAENRVQELELATGFRPTEIEVKTPDSPKSTEPAIEDEALRKKRVAFLEKRIARLTDNAKSEIPDVRTAAEANIQVYQRQLDDLKAAKPVEPRPLEPALERHLDHLSPQPGLTPWDVEAAELSRLEERVARLETGPLPSETEAQSARDQLLKRYRDRMAELKSRIPSREETKLRLQEELTQLEALPAIKFDSPEAKEAKVQVKIAESQLARHLESMAERRPLASSIAAEDLRVDAEYTELLKRNLSRRRREMKEIVEKLRNERREKIANLERYLYVLDHPEVESAPEQLRFLEPWSRQREIIAEAFRRPRKPGDHDPKTETSLFQLKRAIEAGRREAEIERQLAEAYGDQGKIRAAKVKLVKIEADRRFFDLVPLSPEEWKSEVQRRLSFENNPEFRKLTQVLQQLDFWSHERSELLSASGDGGAENRERLRRSFAAALRSEDIKIRLAEISGDKDKLTRAKETRLALAKEMAHRDLEPMSDEEWTAEIEKAGDSVSAEISNGALIGVVEKRRATLRDFDRKKYAFMDAQAMLQDLRKSIAEKLSQNENYRLSQLHLEDLERERKQRLAVAKLEGPLAAAEAQFLLADQAYTAARREVLQDKAAAARTAGRAALLGRELGSASAAERALHKLVELEANTEWAKSGSYLAPATARAPTAWDFARSLCPRLFGAKHSRR